MATYLIINLVVVTALIPGLLIGRREPGRAWGLALAVLLLLTAIFDNVIVKLGIVGYDTTKILGLKVGVVPIEDFFYALAAMLIVPALWNGRRSRE